MKGKPNSPTKANIRKELNQMLKALEAVEKIKSGKIKTRPVEDLLKEL